MACPLTVVADGTVVSIGDASAAQGEEVRVSINIIDVSDLRAANIWLEYDSGVVRVTRVADGAIGTITYSIDNANEFPG